MEEEPSLPVLPPSAIEPSSSRPRKRVRLSSPLLSSDPAIFSSDDDPSLENYSSNRQKNRYRGTWFQKFEGVDSSSIRTNPTPTTQLQFGQKRSKRIFERQYDSGIFLGSDTTDMDESVEGLDEASHAADLNSIATLPDRSMSKEQSSLKTTPTAEDTARKQIDFCVENGIELIDLSHQSLTMLSNEIIRPLVALTTFRGAYSAFNPRLQLFLASNSLTTLPEELFNLDHLAVLSLRVNDLRELPPAIGRLRNIEELNISQTGLQHLPFEILDLFSETSRLDRFQIHPNPFLEPKLCFENTEATAEEPRYRIGLRDHTRPMQRGVVCPPTSSLSLDTISWHPQWNICYKARSEVRFLNIDGSHCQGPNFDLSQSFLNGVAIADDTQTPVPPKHCTRVPSLLEVALQACSKTVELPYLASKLPYYQPAHFSDLLGKTIIKKDSGGSKCTICKRNFIIPRTEWIEWWEIGKVLQTDSLSSAASPLRGMENERDHIEKIIPLMRRGCSWRCVPEMRVLAVENTTNA